jgi:hypothetical protein
MAAKQARIDSLRLQLQRAQSLLASARELLGELDRPTTYDSPVPPSANPTAAPRPVSKKPSGRKPAGHTGHVAG